uniref:Uncharacterized protein n=1 Tax=Arundo donax TaxID=35708 RepID=A0A0A8ZRC8_ARUDO
MWIPEPFSVTCFFLFLMRSFARPKSSLLLIFFPSHLRI